MHCYYTTWNYLSQDWHDEHNVRPSRQPRMIGTEVVHRYSDNNILDFRTRTKISV